jgi:hypothetical protein
MAHLMGTLELGRIKQSMLLGLARHPLALSDRLAARFTGDTPTGEQILAVLALAAQRQRFARPQADGATARVPPAARRMHEDQRPILPEGARRALLRLANGLERSHAGAVLRIAVRRITRAGFRLHPFDLPRLLPHIRDDADHLGLAERAYLSLVERSAKETASVLHADITAENWREFPKGHRVAFVQNVRRQDPAAGRALVEAAFKSEAADMRGALIAALAAGLSADDLAFLAAAVADRAESVRAAAAQLCAQVPGTPAFAERLTQAARCFVRDGSGLTKLLKRARLAPGSDVTFTPPKAANRNEQAALLHRMFEGLSLSDLANAAGLTVAEVLSALPADHDPVSNALMATARRHGRGEELSQLVEHRLARAASGSFPNPFELAALAAELPEPLRPDFAAQLLGSSGWQSELERLSAEGNNKDDGTLVWTALMLPEAAMPRFPETLARVPAATARSARDVADLMINLRTTDP